MKLPIYAYGHPIYKAPLQAVSSETPDLEKLIRDLRETLFLLKAEGICARQVGQPLDLFIVDTSTQGKRDQRLFMNARLKKELGSLTTFMEHDLGIPGLEVSVDRLGMIEIFYQNEKFEGKEEQFGGKIARTIQHFYDLNQGITMIDRLNSFRQRSLKYYLRQVSSGRVEAPYELIYPSF